MNERIVCEVVFTKNYFLNNNHEILFVRIKFRLVDNETKKFYLCGAHDEFLTNNKNFKIDELLTTLS